MTPQEFATTYVDGSVDDYVCLVHDPRSSSPGGRTFTVEYVGNVVEGGIVKYLNVDVSFMKQLARQSIERGEPVWFGYDTGKMSRRDLGHLGPRPLRLRRALRDGVHPRQGGAPELSRDADDARDALHGCGHHR